MYYQTILSFKYYCSSSLRCQSKAKAYFTTSLILLENPGIVTRSGSGAVINEIKKLLKTGDTRWGKQNKLLLDRALRSPEKTTQLICTRNHSQISHLRKKKPAIVLLTILQCEAHGAAHLCSRWYWLGQLTRAEGSQRASVICWQLQPRWLEWPGNARLVSLDIASVQQNGWTPFHSFPRLPRE